MPPFLAFLLPFLVRLALKIGLPALEKRFPFIVPIAEEILKLIGGQAKTPSPNLQTTALQYNALCSGDTCKA